MDLYGRKPLEPGTEITTQLVDCFDAETVVGTRTLHFAELVSSGGSCLVYKGELIETSGKADTRIPVLIKECYPPYDKCMLSRNGIYLEPEKESEQVSFDNLKENFLTEQQVVSRFYRETSQKDIFLAQEVNNTVYIISLYGKGRTLDQIERSELNPEKISRIMYSLCENLYKLHTLKSGGYLYLDCKPENIFCEEAGGVFANEKRTKVALFDFDTAVPLVAVGVNVHKTVSGSEGWAAPEQIIVKGNNGKRYNNPKKINKKTDIFSAGAVFYKLLTGEKIEFSKTDRTELDQISNGVFPWAEENIKNEEERELVKKILRSSLAYDNDDRRYESFHEMMEDFEELTVLTEGSLKDRQSIYAELRDIKETVNGANEVLNLVNEKLSYGDSAERQQLHEDILDANEQVTAEGIEKKKEQKSESPELETVHEKTVKRHNQANKRRTGVILGILFTIIITVGIVLLILTNLPSVDETEIVFLPNSDTNGASLYWGDSDNDRASYTTEEVNNGILGDSILFNSLSDGKIGDEKNFVAAKTYGNKKSWQADTIYVSDGERYTIRLYIHNDNPLGMEAVAEGVNVQFGIPTTVSNTLEVKGYINCSNSVPEQYWDGVVFSSKESFYIEYVGGSAKYYNSVMGNVSIGNDIVISNGYPIGYEHFDGTIPGGYDYAGVVTIDVIIHKSVEAKLSVSARLEGTNTWEESIGANAGDIIEFKIEYQNLLNRNVDNVMLRDVLPENMEYVENSTVLYNSHYPDGVPLDDNTITMKGLNIGSYAPKGNAWVQFSAKIIDKSLEKGSNQLVNWGSATVNGRVYKDDASVMVNK